MDVTGSATRLPAEMMGKADELGTVEVGKRADVIVTAGDPLSDPSCLRELRWVIADGVVRTPQQWMRSA